MQTRSNIGSIILGRLDNTVLIMETKTYSGLRTHRGLYTALLTKHLQSEDELIPISKLCRKLVKATIVCVEKPCKVQNNKLHYFL